jgi:AraC-like DNA-binding protein
MDFGVRVSTDVDDLSHGMQGWEQLYRQISPGAFEGVIAQAEAPDFQFFREMTNRRVAQSGVSPAKLSSIAVPLSKGVSATFQGIRFGGYAMMLLGPGEPFRIHTSEAFHYFGVSVPTDEMIHLADAVAGDGARRSFKRAVLSVSGAQGELMRARLTPFFARYERTPLLLQNSIASKRFRDELLGVLLDLLVPANTVERNVTHATYADLVRRSERILQEKEEGTVTVLDLCVALRCSRRTLQTSFQQVTNLTPIEYLRAVRLNAVRRLLRSTAIGELGIGEAAGRWGFTHASYFAREYRELFGELPSQTARRS